MLRIVLNEYLRIKREKSLENQGKLNKLGKIVDLIIRANNSIGNN